MDLKGHGCNTIGKIEMIDMLITVKSIITERLGVSVEVGLSRTGALCSHSQRPVLDLSHVKNV